MLVGSKEFIEEARIVRKMLGGGMRQAGVLAAARLIALEESPKRLHIDHANAKFLADELAQIPGIKIDPAKVVTNILFFDVSATGMTGFDISKLLAARGVLANASTAQRIRMVTHLDVDRAEDARGLSKFCAKSLRREEPRQAESKPLVTRMDRNANLSFLVERAEHKFAIIPILNGVPLTDMILLFERENGYAPAGGYGGLIPDYFKYGPLDRYFLGDFVSDM